MNKEVKLMSNYFEFDINYDESSLISSTSDYSIKYDEFCETLLNAINQELQKLKEIQINELESKHVDMNIKSMRITCTIPYRDDGYSDTKISFHSNIVLEETDENFKNRKKEVRRLANRNKEEKERVEYERLHKKYGPKS